MKFLIIGILLCTALYGESENNNTLADNNATKVYKEMIISKKIEVKVGDDKPVKISTIKATRIKDAFVINFHPIKRNWIIKNEYLKLHYNSELCKNFGKNFSQYYNIEIDSYKNDEINITKLNEVTISKVLLIFLTTQCIDDIRAKEAYPEINVLKQKSKK